MTDTKFTPGPWKASAEIGNDNFSASIYGPAGDYDALLIARCDQNGSHPADTHLIAAAPELYGALRAALRFIDASPADPARFLTNQIECALAKAEGRKADIAYRPEDAARGT